MFPFFYDPSFIIILPAIILAMFAQNNVKNAFKKYSKVYSTLGITGAELAQQILRRYGIYDVSLYSIDNNLIYINTMINRENISQRGR